ncbi:MAG: cyclic nucleotide-binding domain-containing protein [Candidatus Scalindua sp.]
MENLLVKKEFKKGETIVTEGIESYNVYVITSGEADIIKNYLGKEICVRTLKKGDVFGALALIAKSPRAATVVAKTDLEAEMMYREDFLSILKKLPSEVKEVMKQMVDELKAAYELSAELTVLTNEMRDIRERMKSSESRKILKEHLGQAPEIVQTWFTSLEHSLMDMIHNYAKQAKRLDEIIVEVDTLFKK